MNGQTRIEQMYAFIIVDTDGTEGIPAFTTASGMAMPLVGADMNRVNSLFPLAQALADSHGKPIELVKFTNREHLNLIQPKGDTAYEKEN